MTIGLLHPGNMGAAVGYTLRNGGAEVLWAGEGRSARSRERAAKMGLSDAGTMGELCRRSEVIVSVCPPEFADAVADRVVAEGFAGVFVDANAIQPARAVGMGRRLEQAGVQFVDGGIIGPAVMKPDTTWMYLSGAAAGQAAECFAAGPMRAEVVGPAAGQASGLKMCFAAYNKGRAALMAATMAAAESFGVREIVHEKWQRRDGVDRAEAEEFVTSMAPRAWRFVAEMHEIADTFEGAGLPRGFHEGAAAVYEMLREFKDAEDVPMERLLEAMLKPKAVG